MDTLPYHDFRGFIEEAKKVSAWRLIEGADWDNEIGALIEATAELDERPMLLFDKIKDYPAGFRLVSLAFANYKRTALAFGISPEKTKLEVVRLLARKMKSGKSIPAAEVKASPLMENVMQGRPGRSAEISRAALSRRRRRPLHRHRRLSDQRRSG